MKITVANFCFQCNEDAEKLGQNYTPNGNELVFVELNELGIYHYSCPNKHEQTMILKQQLFQVLFDLGALALNDSYTREAVSSFSSSLERFFEFIIKLIAFSEDMDEKIFDGLWKNIPYSERQLGAYVSLFSHKFKINPDILDDNLVKFRNDVIHKGKIPNSTKTLEYGQVIANIIVDTLFEAQKYLGKDFRKAFAKLETYNLRKIERDYPNIKNVSLSFMKTIIEVNFNEPFERKTLSLEEVISNLKKTKNIFPYIK